MKVKEYLNKIGSGVISPGLKVIHNTLWKFEILEDLGDKVKVIPITKSGKAEPFLLNKFEVLNYAIDPTILNESTDYTATYPTPDNNSQSFVVLSLCIGQAKFHEPALNTLGRLPEKDEETMIGLGIRVLEGKMEASTYVDKLFSIFKKLYKDDLVVLGKNKDQESYMRDQLELRVKGNSSTVKNVNLNKQVLKESLEDMVSDYMKTHPRVTSEEAVKEVLKDVEFTDEEKEELKSMLKENRSEKVDLIFGKIKNYMTSRPGTKFQDAMIEVLKGVQHKDGDLILTEMAYGSDYEPKVLDYLSQKGSKGAVGKELIALFSTPTMSIPVLQRMLKSGAVIRDNSTKPITWYLPSKAPAGIDTVAKVIERKPKALRPSAREEKNKLLLAQIESDFKYFRPGGYSGSVENEYGMVSSSFRSLGNWINNEEDRYDDDFDESDWEDNDNRIWAPGEYKKYSKLFIEWAKKYPWYKKVDLELLTSEKDWCEFVIKLKREKVTEEILKEGYYESYVIWLKSMTVNSNNGPIEVKAGEYWEFDRKPFAYFAIKGSVAVLLDNYENEVDYKIEEVKRAG